MTTGQAPARTGPLTGDVVELGPGGRFQFTEHVAAPPGAMLRGIQRTLDPAHRLLTGGCSMARDTGPTIRAAGFTRVDLAEVAVRGPFGVRIPRIVGSAYHG